MPYAPILFGGPGDRHLIPRLIDRAKQGKLLKIGNGENLIDMVYVENAAAAHLLAADALQAGRAGGCPFFISQGEPVRCWAWINEILGMVGLGPVTTSIPYRVAWGAGAMCEAAYWTFGLRGEPRMTRFLASQLAQPHYFDISAARQELGYVPHVSTEKGMRRLANSLRRE